MKQYICSSSARKSGRFFVVRAGSTLYRSRVGTRSAFGQREPRTLSLFSRILRCSIVRQYAVAQDVRPGLFHERDHRAGYEPLHDSHGQVNRLHEQHESRQGQLTRTGSGDGEGEQVGRKHECA